MPAYVYCVVQRAEDVLIGDPSGTSDCFVRAFLEGQKKQAKTTRVISKNLHPVWNMALSMPVPKAGSDGGVLMLELFDDNWTGKELLGFATVTLAGLAAGEARDLQLDLQWREGVKLKYSGDRPSSRGLGKLFVRVGAGETKQPPKDFLECSALQGSEDLTKVPEGLLQSPVKRLGVSGGTAPFFALKLTPEQCAATGRPSDAFIGKDLSHAEGEAAVYEEILALLRAAEAGDDPNGLGDLLRFTMEYRGIFTAPEDTGSEDTGSSAEQQQQQPLDLLVLQNLHCGCEKLRLLDIKMGEKTASAGWKGKSHTAAKKQGVIDSMTNSAAEGFRLEGFDGAPESLTSMNPLVNVPGALKGLVNPEKANKKARRILMQRLSAADVASHYLRLPYRGSGELQEIVMHETLSKVAALAVACRKVRVPQKWVGSSVALGFDAAARLAAGEAAVRSQVIVQVFDWGRSELNVQTKYAAMTPSERSDRIEFWNNYKMGINKLSFEIARFYHHRFNNADPRPRLVAKVWDLDSLTDNDLIGFVELELSASSASSLTTVPLSNDSSNKPCGALTYATEWVEAPQSSRLAGWWRVTLQGATGLLAMDFNGLSDPFATLTASSGDFRTTFQTCVVERDLNPVWDEVFEVPVARPGTRRIAEALESSWLSDKSALPSPEGFDSMLPAPTMIHDTAGGSRRASNQGSADFLKNVTHFDAWNKVLDTVQCPEVLSPVMM